MEPQPKKAKTCQSDIMHFLVKQPTKTAPDEQSEQQTDLEIQPGFSKSENKVVKIQ